jgi:hypothetical protein
LTFLSLCFKAQNFRDEKVFGPRVKCLSLETDFNQVVLLAAHAQGLPGMNVLPLCFNATRVREEKIFRLFELSALLYKPIGTKLAMFVAHG